jgi:hypothetical protein
MESKKEEKKEKIKESLWEKRALIKRLLIEHRMRLKTSINKAPVLESVLGSTLNECELLINELKDVKEMCTIV